MRRFKPVAATLIFISTMTSVASATSIQQRYFADAICYARTYEAAHLRAMPRQTVKHFHVARDQQVSGHRQDLATFAVRFGFTVKDHDDAYLGTAECRPAGQVAHCLVEGDGGSFSLSSDGSKLRVTLSDRLEIEGSSDFSPNLATGDNRVMLLHPTVADTCTAY